MSFGMPNDYTGTNIPFFNGQTKTSDGRTIRRDGKYQYVYDRNGKLISKTPINFTNTGSNKIGSASPSAAPTSKSIGGSPTTATWVGPTSKSQPTGAKTWAGANAASSGQSVSSASVPSSSGGSGGGSVGNPGNAVGTSGTSPSGGTPGATPDPNLSPMTGWFQGVNPKMAPDVMGNAQQLANLMMWQQGMDPLGRNSAGANILSRWSAAAPVLYDIAAYGGLPGGSPVNFNIQDQADWVGNFLKMGAGLPNANNMFGQLGGATGDPTSAFYQTYFAGDPQSQASSLSDLVGAITQTGSSFNQQRMAQAMMAYATNKWMQDMMFGNPESVGPLAEYFLRSIGAQMPGVSAGGPSSGNQSIGG